jgi:alkanesulfonate monooxygenase SsuD/methylene tetrahydromethanopterin reductase-like flavin-dependent oxidoreductase (luciferase family)
MRLFYHCDMSYPQWPAPDQYDTAIVTLPNRYFDPAVGHDLYKRYIDEFVFADQVGLDLMVNEHHQTPTCLSASAPMLLGILARVTSNARLLVLGNPIARRLQPIRVAEEMAMIDVISGGRLECGFVRSVPYEVAATNSNPVRDAERMWEAHDLILKAWTSHDGPFSFEGKYYSHRLVNIWPRPVQQPTPPIWMTGSSPQSCAQVGERGYVLATFGSGYDRTPAIFDSYRKGWESANHSRPFDLDRLAYTSLTYVGATDAEAREAAEHLLWFYNRPAKAPLHFANPPGYASPAANVSVLRTGKALSGPMSRTSPLTVDEAISKGLLFCGTPDTVVGQIKRFHDAVGGFGNLVCQAHGGALGHEETITGIRLLARDVYPQLKELSPVSAAA